MLITNTQNDVGGNSVSSLFFLSGSLSSGQYATATATPGRREDRLLPLPKVAALSRKASSCFIITDVLSGERAVKRDTGSSSSVYQVDTVVSDSALSRQGLLSAVETHW
jgi:hypothetical protein